MPGSVDCQIKLNIKLGGFWKLNALRSENIIHRIARLFHLRFFTGALIAHFCSLMH